MGWCGTQAGNARALGCALAVLWLAPGCGSGGSSAPADDAARADAHAIDAKGLDGSAPDATRDARLPDGAWPDASPADAAADCGCVTGQYCDLSRVCQSGPVPIGAFCGVTDSCKSSDPNYPACMDSQCGSGRCAAAGADGLVLFRSVCSGACKIYQDNDSDGINDVDAPSSDCDPTELSDGPSGTAYRCVNHAEPASNTLGFCVPGSDFAECNSNADCAGEVCELSSIGGALSLRCYARYRANSSWPAEVVSLGQTCNNDLASGPLVYCDDGLCLDDGLCSAYCVGDSDCDMPAQRCTNLSCENAPTRSCITDPDCRIAECAGVADYGGGAVFSYCTKKL